MISGRRLKVRVGLPINFGGIRICFWRKGKAEMNGAKNFLLSMGKYPFNGISLLPPQESHPPVQWLAK